MEKQQEYHIAEISQGEQKSLYARAVLESLPDWFGNKESLEEYVKGVADLPFWAALDGEGNAWDFFP